jgi:hypothetical protein
MSSTELATFNRPNRQPRMPSRPPPPPPPPAAQDQVVPQGPPPPPPAPAAAAGSEEQVVPQGPPEQLAEPTSGAPGAMRTRSSRARQAMVVGQRRSPPPRPSRGPMARSPPPSHRMLIPAWAVLANDIWFACPMCAEAIAHSGVVCGQCWG